MIDGARDRWYPLLLLDAGLSLLLTDEYTFISKKAFNQKKVLYDSIIHAAKLADMSSKREDYVHLPKDFHWPESGINCITSSPASHYYPDLDESELEALQLAMDARECFPCLVLIISDTASSTQPCRSMSQLSPFAKRQRTTQTSSNSTSSTDQALNVFSPWHNIDDFRQLALSDPPAKSRNKFESAVNVLCSHPCFRKDVMQLKDILHLVVCKVLLHWIVVNAPKASVRRRRFRLTPSTAVSKAVNAFSSTFTVEDPHIEDQQGSHEDDLLDLVLEKAPSSSSAHPNLTHADHHPFASNQTSLWKPHGNAWYTNASSCAFHDFECTSPSISRSHTEDSGEERTSLRTENCRLGCGQSQSRKDSAIWPSSEMAKYHHGSNIAAEPIKVDSASQELYYDEYEHNREEDFGVRNRMTLVFEPAMHEETFSQDDLLVHADIFEEEDD